MSVEVGLAFCAGLTGALGVRELLSAGGAAARLRGPRAGRAIALTVDALVRIGREGRDPGTVERRRLLLAGAGAAFVIGTLLAGPAVGAALVAGGPLIVARALRARREHYRRVVDEGAASMAVALADAVGGGHSLRSAVAEAARSVGGPAGHELRRVAAELAAGAPTDRALESMRARIRSHWRKSWSRNRRGSAFRPSKGCSRGRPPEYRSGSRLRLQYGRPHTRSKTPSQAS